MEAFMFHREWLDCIAGLTEEEQGRVLLAVARMSFNGGCGDIRLSPVEGMAVRCITASVNRDGERHARSVRNGRRGGRPRKASAPEDETGRGSVPDPVTPDEKTQVSDEKTQVFNEKTQVFNEKTQVINKKTQVSDEKTQVFNEETQVSDEKPLVSDGEPVSFPPCPPSPLSPRTPLSSYPPISPFSSCCSSDSFVDNNEGDEWSEAAALAEAEEEEKQQQEILFEFFFLRNYADAENEVEKFIAWNNNGGRRWRRMDAEERKSALKLWKQQPERRGRFPPRELEAWRNVYEAIAANAPPGTARMAMSDTVSWKSEGGWLELSVPDGLHDWMEENIGLVRGGLSELMRLRGASRLRYNFKNPQSK